MNQYEAEYLVIGGFAFAVFVEPRYTKDLDIFLRTLKKNAKKLLRILNDFGFEELTITEDDLLVSGKVFQLGNPPLRIDLLNSIDGITFEEAWQNKITSEYGKETIKVIGKQKLIKKKVSGRDQDLLDVK